MNCCKLAMKVWAAAFAVAVGAALPLGADVTLTENVTLDADTDWRDQGVVTIAEGVTLDLNGYTLRVSALAGTGGVVDSDSGQYESLEYIEANGQQGIVTDLKPGADTKVDVVFTPMARDTSTLFGTKWGNSGFLAFGSGGTWYGLFNTQNGTFSAGTRYRFIVDSGTATLQNDETGQNVSSKSGVNMSGSNLPLAICCCGIGTQPGRFKIHSFKVWHENVMLFDFVPVREAATGAVGLFNRVDDTFHVSGSTTPFIAGPMVGNLRIEAASEAALADFTGTVADTVYMAIDGDCTLTADADWRRFPTLRIDGTVDLAGHNLRLCDLRGTGTAMDLGDTPLKYVDSTAQQVVRTGIVPSTDTAVEIDFTLTGANEGMALFGCDKWSGQRYMLAVIGGLLRFFGDDKSRPPVTVGSRYRLSLTPDGAGGNNGIMKIAAVVGGVAQSETAYNSNNLTNGGNSELLLFNVATGDRPSSYRLHSFKITKAGELKRDLVPMRKNKKAGLYDRVTGDFLVSSTDVDLVAGPAADDADLGRLHVNVAEGRTVVADSLALSGTLALVKEGAGTLTMNRSGQTYTGGTRIEAGVLDTMSRTSSDYTPYQAGKYFLGASGSDIVVGTGAGGPAAVFDFKGNVNYRIYNMCLNGGTLRNGGYDQATNDGSLGHLTLTADSTIETAFNTVVFHATTDIWNLDTHTLSVDTMGKTLYFTDAVNITNGVFWTKGAGWWKTGKAVNMRGATLRAESAISLGAQLDVDDYYAACTTDANDGKAAMNVYGRFTPATDYFYGCTMQHGSVLDLNGRSGAWSTASAFTAGSNRVTFAPGATVTVDVHAHRPWSGKVVDWGEGNAPEGVAFRLDEESKAMGRALSVRADGLYAVSGILMIVR
ncbi:MAG: autotransporter-associated beta strand repeat-containing protein [Kiritimatiellae bacterium]|nr:autotransporter-associated beta strand repeat-containing protein [Kiritimatiellia bacterium]